MAVTPGSDTPSKHHVLNNALSFAITTLQQEQQVAPEDFAAAWRKLTGEEPPDWSTERPSTADPS